MNVQISDAGKNILITTDGIEKHVPKAGMIVQLIGTIMFLTPAGHKEIAIPFEDFDDASSPAEITTAEELRDKVLEMLEAETAIQQEFPGNPIPVDSTMTGGAEGNFFVICFTEESVIESIDGHDDLAGKTYPAGYNLYVKTTNIQLTSGAADCYEKESVQ